MKVLWNYFWVGQGHSTMPWWIGQYVTIQVQGGKTQFSQYRNNNNW